jgi:flavin-dependent dehydrogenase
MNPFGSGFHLERAAFDQMMRDKVALANGSEGVGKHGSIGALVKGKVVAVERSEDGNGWLIRWKKNVESETSELRTRWIVNATGRKASIATKVSTSERHLISVE